MPATAPSARRDFSLRRLAAFVLLPIATLGGCALVDQDQARICRMALPTLEPAGTSITVLRGAATDGGIRIDYRASQSGRPALDRFAICRFSPANRVDLTGIATDRGEVPGATVFLLKRYYLDTPEGAAGDPGPPLPDSAPLNVPPALGRLMQSLIAGLPGIAIYGLLASAYGLLYGLVGRINLAFGEIAAIGAAAIGLVVAGCAALGADASALVVAVGLTVALGAAALYGVVVGSAAFRLVDPRRSQASLIATVGLSLVLSEYLRLSGGALPAWLPPLGQDAWTLARGGDVTVTASPSGILVAVIGLVAGSALVVLMRRSRFGRDWRAASDDGLAAALCGIDRGRLLVTTLALSGALAGLAGALIALRFGALGFAGGFGLGLKALAAAILGGIGSVGGGLIGGLALGLFETLWSTYLPIASRDLAVYVLLVAAIMWRPYGLFGGGADRTAGFSPSRPVRRGRRGRYGRRRVPPSRAA